MSDGPYQPDSDKSYEDSEEYEDDSEDDDKANKDDDDQNEDNGKNHGDFLHEDDKKDDSVVDKNQPPKSVTEVRVQYYQFQCFSKPHTI